MRLRAEQFGKKTQLIESIDKLHSTIRALCPNKSLPSSESLSSTPSKAAKPTAVAPPARPMSVPTAAALKMGVGFPLTNLPGINDDTNRILSTQCQQQGMKTPPPPELLFDCGICKQVNDQHCLVQCDTCQLHFHLGCLSPPLTRHPKKSKIYGWQCSECDEDNPEGAVPIATGPRKSRTKYSKDGTIVPVEVAAVNGTAAKENKTETRATCMSPSSVKSEPKASARIKSPIQSDASVSEANKTPKSEKQAKRRSSGKRKKKLSAESTEEAKKPKKSASPVKSSQLEDSINKDITASTENNDSLNTSQELERSPPKKRKPKPKVHKKISDPSEIDSIIDLVIRNSTVEDSPAEDTKQAVVKPEEVADTVLEVKPEVASEPSSSRELPSKEERTEQEEKSSRKQSRKRRKEKHRSKDRSERSSSKEHKKKRKRKNHDQEKPISCSMNSDGVPKIKIKVNRLFTLILPGDKHERNSSLSSSKQCQRFQVKQQPNPNAFTFPQIW